MRMLASVMIVGLLTSLAPARAQQGKEDPLDKQLSACLDSPAGSSTVGMQECSSKAYDAWDQELNKTYQKLLTGLDEPSRELLRASQRQWIAFRDAEKAFHAGPWGRKRGTIFGISVGMANVEIVRSRVMTLRGYL